MKVSDFIATYLQQQGVSVVFGYIGGMITYLADSIAHNRNIAYVQVYHEQTASIAAEGYAKESGKLGVSISSSGPGATNMITGIADAYFDSIPVLYITGQVNTYEYKYQKEIRQQGFQETDVVSMVKHITKYAKMVDVAEEICYELEKACWTAKSGRRGPVLIDIPMNIQRAEIDPSTLPHFIPEEDASEKINILEDVLSLIAVSKRPMVLVGGGAYSEEGREEVDKFLRKTGFPVVVSLKGKGCVNEELSNYIGMIGSYGNRSANMCISNADLLIVLGSRLDTRQTGAKIEGFLTGGKIIHVDIDSNELKSHRVKGRLEICSDLVTFLTSLNAIDVVLNDISAWCSYIGKIKTKYNQDLEIDRFVENKAPYRLMQTINAVSKDNTLFCTDVGQNQMWAAQTIKLKDRDGYATSGGLAPMGFSIPYAVGAAFSKKYKKIVAICGDGGFHISTQALMLISQYNLPITVVIANNSALGMITQFQSLYFGGRMVGATSEGGYVVPDIRAIANAYGLNYFRITEESLADTNLIDEIFSERNCIIDFEINGVTVVSPKLEFDKPLYNPSPQLSAEELSDNMIINID